MSGVPIMARHKVKTVHASVVPYTVAFRSLLFRAPLDLHRRSFGWEAKYCTVMSEVHLGSPKLGPVLYSTVLSFCSIIEGSHHRGACSHCFTGTGLL